MKTSNAFKQVISSHLELLAINDSLFAVTLNKPNKSIDECINYILDTVQKSGINGFEDSEIFNMAVHYYDEDNIKNIKSSNGKVVVNHAVQLTEADKEEAKKQAMERAVEEYKKDIKVNYVPDLDETEMAEAKDRAMNLAVAEAQKKMLEKKKPVSKPIPVAQEAVAIEPAQGSLF